MAASCGDLKATLGTFLVCAAVQQGKAMHRENCGDDHLPVTRGYMSERGAPSARCSAHIRAAASAAPGPYGPWRGLYMMTPAQHYVDGAVDTGRATGELSSPPPPPPGPAPVRGPQAQHQVPMSWCGWWLPLAEWGGGGGWQGCKRKLEGGEIPAPPVRRAVGGDCQSGWGRLLSVTNAMKLALGVRGTVAGRRLGALEGGMGFFFMVASESQRLVGSILFFPGGLS